MRSDCKVVCRVSLLKIQKIQVFHLTHPPQKAALWATLPWSRPCCPRRTWCERTLCWYGFGTGVFMSVSLDIERFIL